MLLKLIKYIIRLFTRKITVDFETGSFGIGREQHIDRHARNTYGENGATLIWGANTHKLSETPDVLSEIISGRAIREMGRAQANISDFISQWQEQFAGIANERPEFSATLSMPGKVYKRMQEHMLPLAYNIRLTNLISRATDPEKNVAALVNDELLIGYGDAWQVISTQSIFGSTPGFSRMDWYVALHKQYANAQHYYTVQAAKRRLDVKWGWVDKL